MGALICPNCGGTYNPAKYCCEFCGSFILMSNDKQFNVPQSVVEEIERKIKSALSNVSDFPGVYVFGTLLGKGEVPLRFGVANVNGVGGKCLLTASNLYFSSHNFIQSKTEFKLSLSDLQNAKYDRNVLFSDQISIYAFNKRFVFNLYGGREWVRSILDAKAKALLSADNINADYMAELVKLKQLLDANIITQEDFDIKKRMLLGI